ncbi:hypothetical protein [Wenjunlia tyrosinilytica]|uniref:Uncharacterized protein n=1 Tax=Wenjunlia tyrosinilytica TaxID=1544741 RepID=A0A917ZWK0_9ACTN|nr:hypothetical protein [Wenjunlia tyrosinilytica]GGO97881.1 hypothetical protein GCM10012280_60710 [Wenjunlia tyrosinilytica]
MDETGRQPRRDTTVPMLRAIANLARFHREHEAFYATAPRERAVALQRSSRTMLALADHWAALPPAHPAPLSPFEDADDLTSPAAIQLSGVVFAEGQGEPVEITRLKRELRVMADDSLGTCDWLVSAMQASWDAAAALLDLDEFADLLGERHRIISNDWQAAHLSGLAGRLLRRATETLDRIDFSPEALRADLAGDATAPRRLYSAAELTGHAADLLSDSAGLVHDNERRWRIFRARVASLSSRP